RCGRGAVGSALLRSGLPLGDRRGPPLGQSQIQRHGFSESGDDGPFVVKGVARGVGLAERVPLLDQSRGFEGLQLPRQSRGREPPEDRPQLAGADGLPEIDRRQDFRGTIPYDTLWLRLGWRVPDRESLAVSCRTGRRQGIRASCTHKYTFRFVIADGRLGLPVREPGPGRPLACNAFRAVL